MAVNQQFHLEANLFQHLVFHLSALVVTLSTKVSYPTTLVLFWQVHEHNIQNILGMLYLIQQKMKNLKINNIKYS